MEREQPAAIAVVVGGVDDIYPNAAGFPRFAVLRAAAVDTRDDLLSLLGIPAIAIVGAVANAVFPRAHHGLFSHSWLRDPISIVTGLMLLEATWLAFRVGMASEDFQAALRDRRARWIAVPQFQRLRAY